MFNLNTHANFIEIKVKIQDEIITNIDIENELNYLIFLNPKLENLEIKQAYNIAKNSLITEIIKKKELEKFINFDEENNLVESLEKSLLLKKNIKDTNEFKSILKKRNLSYNIIKKKLFIEAVWNQLIYQKYSKNLVINKEELKDKILYQIEKEDKKYEYNLSEIVFKEEIDKNFHDKLNEIENSIKDIGFENAANIYSVSNTAKNGGLIGWISELQISEQINNNIKQLQRGEISSSIKISNAHIIIKLNDKKEIKNEINLDKQLENLIKQETNRQLNNFAIVFYKRLKKNLEINEY